MVLPEVLTLRAMRTAGVGVSREACLHDVKTFGEMKRQSLKDSDPLSSLPVTLPDQGGLHSNFAALCLGSPKHLESCHLVETVQKL